MATATTTKGAAKGGAKAAAKAAAKKAPPKDEGFTSGPANPNLRAADAPKRPVQGELIPDRRITELDNAAREYEDVKLQRMALTTREVECKDKLKGLMKKHKKEEYLCDGIEIYLTHEEVENVKVKVAKKADEDD